MSVDNSAKAESDNLWKKKRNHACRVIAKYKYRKYNCKSVSQRHTVLSPKLVFLGEAFKVFIKKSNSLTE